jgi:AAA15 family ATPase/GTPase
MIIDFTITNFRSIKDAQVLSLHVEHPKSHLQSHVAYPSGEKIGVLRSAGIYGANASGKSNILLAFKALRHVACKTGNLEDGANIACYEPYSLSEETKNAPVKFEIEFINRDGVRYLYSISFIKTAILEESLDYYPTRQKANIFKRSQSDTWETIIFGGHYKGGVKRIPFFANNSYLSKAGNSAASAELIRSVYSYFMKEIRHMGSREELYIADHDPNEEMLNKVAKLLCSVDTGISAISQKDVGDKVKIVFPEGISEDIKKVVLARNKTEYLFAHLDETGSSQFFKLNMESDGTQKLFAFLPELIRKFSDGGVLVMDELDNSFHPHIAELIIKLFNDKEVNTNSAQLIFSTHNMSLMTPENLRRDQIWFTTKDRGATTLYSLDDFDKGKVTSESPYGRWYDDGRFGGIPNISYLAISELLTPLNKEKKLGFQEVSDA